MKAAQQNILDRLKIFTFSATNIFDINKSITVDLKSDLLKIPESKQKNVLIIPTSNDLKNFFRIIKKKKSKV